MMLRLRERATRYVRIPDAQERFGIGVDERALLVGKTGSGKTTLARSLIANRPYLVVMDTKAEIDLPGMRVVSGIDDLRRIKSDDPSPVVYRPDVTAGRDDHDLMLRWVYERGNTTLYVDEVLAIMEDAPTAPPYYRAILSRGRSRNIRTISATQRPASIPLLLLSETDHVFLFRLQLEEDRRRMAAIIGPRALRPPSCRYCFVYHNLASGETSEHHLVMGGGHETTREHQF